MKTIKIFFVVVLILVFGNSIYAQDLPFSITANAGINVSDMDIQHLRTNPKVGYNFNVTFEYNLPKKFFLQTGIEFTRKGAKVHDEKIADFSNDGKTDILITNGKYDTRYLTMPLMGGYRLPLSNKLRMNLSLGPYFGCGVGGKTELYEALLGGYEEKSATAISLDGDIPNYTISTHVKSFKILRRFDMGIKGNVGIEYYRCLLNIGYEYGFIDQYKADEISSYNMNLIVTVGFRIF